MAYAKGTALTIRPDSKINRTNPARVGTTKSQPNNVRTVLGVARKPAKNKAAK